MTLTPWCLLTVSVLFMVGCLSHVPAHAAAPIRTPGGPPMDAALITGANIDESKITSTLRVGPEHPYKTIRAAFEAAIIQLKAGTPTRILIAPGLYREGELTLDAREDRVLSETLLVIEAQNPGSVIMSGSDEFAPVDWSAVKDEQGQVLYYEHPWPYVLGFNPGGWQQFNPKLPYEHRSEMAFMNGQPLRQIMLEMYQYIPPRADPKNWEKSIGIPEGVKTDPHPAVPQNTFKYGAYIYKGFTDPKNLPEGSFGVAERDENGRKVFLRPIPGIDFDKAIIELAARRHLLWFFGKRNVVLRGIQFEHCAGRIEAHKTVMFGHWWQPEKKFTSGNILIEDCEFRFNNNNQLYINWAEKVTLRRVKAAYGAYGGIITDNLHNSVWEDVECSFNHWRVGGGWASGASKIHNTIGMVIRNYTAIGNTHGCGLWFDISCGNVTVDGLTLVGNLIGLDWEISRHLHVKNALIADNLRHNITIVSGSRMTMENSIVAGSPAVGHFSFQASERPSSENLAPLLGFAKVDKYQLDELTLRNNVIVGWGQPKPAQNREDHNGVYREGYVAPLFVQHHGNPDLFEYFVRNGVSDDRNVWYSPQSQAFGVRKNYVERWDKIPPVNTMVDLAGWQGRTGQHTSQWRNPRLLDPTNGDYRLPTDGPLADRGLPAYVMPSLRLAEWHAFRAATFHKADRRSEVDDQINP